MYTLASVYTLAGEKELGGFDRSNSQTACQLRTGSSIAALPLKAHAARWDRRPGAWLGHGSGSPGSAPGVRPRAVLACRAGRRRRRPGDTSRAWNSFGRPSGSSAPALRRRFSIRRIAFASPDTSSTSISSNVLTGRSSWSTSTESSTTSATPTPSSCTVTPVRRVRRVATALSGRPRVCAIRSRRTCSGTASFGAGHSNSKRLSPVGSLSCQTASPSSPALRRKVIDPSASRRSRCRSTSKSAPARRSDPRQAGCPRTARRAAASPHAPGSTS